MEELNFAIEQSKIKSSPGLDKIDYRIIKKFSPLGRHTLLEIYNKILEKGQTPLDWSKYLMFFIPKNDKSKLRPISLASCLCKVMERMIANRLNWWLEYYNLFPRSQFGFRKQKSCVDNLGILYAEIVKGFYQEKDIPTAFLDIESAYDNVLCEVLIEQLIQIGIPPKTRKFIYNLVAGRQVTGCYGGWQKVFLANRGLPQGAFLVQFSIQFM